MIHALAVVLAVASGPPALAADGHPVLWLVVGASNSSAAGIARAAKALVAKQPAALVFRTRDCGEKKNVFGVALSSFENAEAAKAALRQHQVIAKGAYVKACPVVPRSLLALRVHAVDPSMADPDDALELKDADRISTATPLPGERVLVVQRLVHDTDDNPEAGPLDGVAARIVLVSGPTQRKLLMDDCAFPERITSSGERFAFQCIGSMAADVSLHQIFVFDLSGRQLAKIEECCNPKQPDGLSLVCSKESVVRGKYKLRPTRVALPP